MRGFLTFTLIVSSPFHFAWVWLCTDLETAWDLFYNVFDEAWSNVE